MDSEASRTARTSGAAATQSVRVALQALVKEVRRAQLYGGTRAVAADSRFASMYVAAMRQALAELPVIVLAVTPGALELADTSVLGAADRSDVADRLYAEGTRGISVEAEATDDELLALARLLVTPWGDGVEESLMDAVWLADLHHIAFEMVERVSDRGNEPLLGESPLVRSLLGLVDEINRQNPEELARIRQDEFALLRRLQEELGAEDVAVAARPEMETAIPPALRAEVEAAKAGQDLDGVDVLGLLCACAGGDDSPAIVVAMLTHVVRTMEGAEPEDGAAARLRAQLDPELGADPQLAPRFADWGTLDIHLRRRLIALVEARGEAISGPLFSLLGLLRGDGARGSLTTELPIWAVRVLVDAWMAEDPPRDPPYVARQLITSKQREAVRLGLVLARRLDHLPLVDPILNVLDHGDGELREQALVAVRRYQTPHLKEVVHRLLEDPEEAVRLEALRYVVAYRDLDVVSRLEARLLSLGPAQAADAELRALGIAIGRLLRERAESHLIPVALGARVAAHPFAPSAALHGLRAIGSPTARSAIARIGADVPALSELARTLLGSAR